MGDDKAAGFSPAGRMLIGIALSGRAAGLDTPAFRQEWVLNPTVAEIVSEAISLCRESAFTLAALMARCKSIRREMWPEIISVFRQEREASPQQAMQAAKREYMLRVAREIKVEIERLEKNDPGDVDAWLPAVATKIASAAWLGVSYDPRPSAHLQKPIPVVRFGSRIVGMDDVLRGGYRSETFLLYAAPSKHGKTTTLISHTADLILSGKRVAFINTENTEQLVVARLMMAFGFRESEVTTRSFDDDERRNTFEKWLAALDSQLVVYGWDWLNTKRIERILSWDAPDAIVIDYLKAQPGMFNSKIEPKDPVGDMADFLKNVVTQRAIVISAGQVSGEHAKLMLRSGNHDHEPVPLYGSARPGYASDLYVMIKRSETPGYAKFRVWYDRYTGRLDTVHEIPFDAARKMLALKR